MNTDLNLISSAVSQLVQDNTHLLQEQAADRPALQTAFYHNLLKSNFVSRPEMEYMAQRAGIELTDKTYCAAVLRLFPGIDIDAIDGQTVEDAKVLQQAISAYVDELCVRPVHNYKRNTLETLYMFEIQDQEKLLGVLHRVAAWLHEQYHVEAHWGVGTPCDDLMQFWKSAEEAAAAQHDADGGTAVQVYGSQLGARDGYYFPYVVEERLTQSLSAGDAKAVEDVLSLLQTENFVRRSLNRSRMRQLNRRIVEILSAQTGVIVEENADLMALNELAFDYKGDCEPYFERLNTLCQALCSEVTQQKNARRSENVKAIEEYIRKNYHNPNLGLAMVSAEFNLSEGYLSAISKGDRHQLCRVSGAAPRQGGLCSAAGWLQGFGSAGAAGVQQHPVFPPCVQARDGGQPQRIPRVTHPWRAVGRPIPPAAENSMLPERIRIVGDAAPCSAECTAAVIAKQKT